MTEDDVLFGYRQALFAEAARTSVDAAEANDLAAEIAGAINECRSTYGTKQTHLYLACPWPLASLLGWYLSSSGRLVMHEPDIDRDSYRSSCELS